MKQKTILIIIAIAILIPLVSAGFFDMFNSEQIVEQQINNSGTASISNSNAWILTKATGKEANLTLWTANAKDKKTEIGFIIKEGMTYNTVEKFLYDEDGQILDDKGKPIKLKYESSKCGGLDCYHISLTNAQTVNIDDYIKLGENSIITEYQEDSKIDYVFDWGSLSIQLFKEALIDSNIFVWQKDNGKGWEFGANDSSQDGLSNYTYVVTSTDEFVLTLSGLNYTAPRIYVYEETENWNDERRHWISFDGVCDKKYSNCSWSLSNDKKTFTLNFTADDYFETHTIINVTSCGTLSTPVEYELNQSLSSTSTCLVINADDISLNCKGYNITGDGDWFDYGIVVSSGVSNLTIKNCIVDNWMAGVKIEADTGSTQTNNIVIDNNSLLRGSIWGIDNYGANYVNITNNLIDEPVSYGIQLRPDFYHQPDNPYVVNNTMTGTSGTLNLDSVFDGYFKNNHVANMVGTGSYDCQFFNITTYYENSMFFDSCWDMNFTDCDFSESFSMYMDYDGFIWTNVIGTMFVRDTFPSPLPEFIRRWYYQGCVNGTDGNPVIANVTATNSSGYVEWNVTTNESGCMDEKQIITEFELQGDTVGGTYYYPNTVINYSNSTYISQNSTYNATIDKTDVNDFIIMEFLICWKGLNINLARYCIINEALELYKDLTTYGIGNLTINATITRTSTNYGIKLIKNATDYGDLFLGTGFKLK